MVYLEKLEKEIEKKYKKRERRKEKVKVSGKSIFKLRDLIRKKSD